MNWAIYGPIGPCICFGRQTGHKPDKQDIGPQPSMVERAHKGLIAHVNDHFWNIRKQDKNEIEKVIKPGIREKGQNGNNGDI